MRFALALLLLALPAFSQGGGSGGVTPPDAELERLRIARRALDARMRLADMLREDGKRREALAADATALAMFEIALAPAPVPADRPPFPRAKGPIGEGAPRVRRLAGADPVERGLEWLAAHQDADDAGNWDADGFMKHDPAGDPCDGKGAPGFDVHATALATLAFLGAGYTDRGSAKENPYAKNVRAALRFLMQSQKDDGSFEGASLEGNAVATLAMCEAFAMTRNPRYKKPAADGIRFLLAQQTAGAAWRDPKARDVAVTAWCVAALMSAKRAALEVPEKPFADALAWVDSQTDAETGRFPCAGDAKTEWATAAALCTRIHCGQHPGTDAIRKGAKLCAARPPSWNVDEGTIDMDYWRWGTFALVQVGGEEYRAWSERMKTAILDRQQASGSRAGSWDPVAVEGGRIHSTALTVLCLEIYYRYGMDRVRNMGPWGEER